MSLFDLKPLTMDEMQALHEQRAREGTDRCATIRTTSKTGKIRTQRHKPWWMLLGKGPDGKTCGDCEFFTGYRRTKTYFKCGKQVQTSGPGTDIRKKDEACRLFQQEEVR